MPAPVPGVTDPVTACESCLQDVRARYAGSDVWPSLVNVIDRLLSRRLELADAYAELHRDLPDWRSLDMLFDAVLVAAAFYNRDKINEAHRARDELEKTNAVIASLGHKLAEQLRRREELCNTSGLSTGEHHHIVDLIEEASESNPLFKGYLWEGLDALRYRFDYKYWPSPASCIEVLANDAERATVEAVDALTVAATASRRRSGTADFFKALIEAIAQRSTKRGGFVPEDYLPTDQTLASLGSCALNLQPDQIVAAQQVKSIRQRLRNKAAGQADA